MSRVVVLGGCGGIGGVATRCLVADPAFDEVVVADVRADEAVALATSFGAPGVRGAAVDATSPAALRAVLAGADLAVSCIGPFYRFGAPVLAAAIDAGVDLVDVCDDLDATRAQLALDDAARAAGVCAVIGMGNSPGLANLFARFAVDDLLDETLAVDILHVHGGEPTEGPAVIKHRIHAMVDDVPLFVDGAFRSVRLLEASGQAFVEATDFPAVGRVPCFPYPHPETITMPVHFPGLRRATNRGVVVPFPYFEHTMDVVRRGLAQHPEPAEATIDGWVDAILAERPRFLAEAGLDRPCGCLKVVVEGRRGGEEHTYVFSISSTGAGAGEGTGIPAAMGAALLATTGIRRPGVHPPEAIIPPLALFARAASALEHVDLGGGASGDIPIRIDHLGPDGSVEAVPLPL